MLKKQFLIPLATFILGALVVHLTFFTISDIRGYAPSYTDPLTEEEFQKAQLEGKATFNGSPTIERNSGYSIETLVHCDKIAAICDVTSATIIKYSGGPLLQPSHYSYNITEWSDGGNITAVYEDETTNCGIYSIEANVKTREISIGYKSHSNNDKEQCANEPTEGTRKLDFNMDSESLLGALKSDIHYFLTELIN